MAKSPAVMAAVVPRQVFWNPTNVQSRRPVARRKQEDALCHWVFRVQPAQCRECEPVERVRTEAKEAVVVELPGGGIYLERFRGGASAHSGSPRLRRATHVQAHYVSRPCRPGFQQLANKREETGIAQLGPEARRHA